MLAVVTAWLVAPASTPTGALVALTIATLAWPIVLAVRGTYGPSPFGERGEAALVARALVVFLAVLALGGAVLGRDVSNRSFLAAAGILLAGSVIVRALSHRRQQALQTDGRVVSRTLAVGTGSAISAFVDELANGTDHPFVVVGACVEGDDWLVEDVPQVAWLTPPVDGADPLRDVAPIQHVLDAVRSVEADTVCVMPGSQFSGDRLRALGWVLAERGIDLVTTLGVAGVAPHRMRLGSAGGVTLLHVRATRSDGLGRFLKAAVDRAVAGLALVVALPVFLVIAVAVRAEGSGPVLYRQPRIGRGGRAFTMLKFRTMCPEADSLRADLIGSTDHEGPMFKLRDDPRITKVGRLLRRSSLDELPQLVNVVRGEMSLVGPRPPLPEEVAHYDPVELRRLRATPGMTGLWQVSGRANLSWDETVRLDLQYIDNWTLGQDVRLIGRTAGAVIKGTGAY